MKKQPQTPTPENEDLSGDPELWEFLGKNTSQEASPLFSRNILREIRIETVNKPTFWQNFLRPRHLAPTALATLATVTILLWNPFQQQEKTSLTNTKHSEVIPAEVASTIESTLEAELLVAAADSPDLFSDEEVISMLF